MPSLRLALDPGHRSSGHEPADARRRTDQQGHRGQEHPAEGHDDPCGVLHRPAHLQDDAGIDQGIENSHFILAGVQNDRFKHRAVAGQQLLDRLFAYGDILPVGHARR